MTLTLALKHDGVAYLPVHSLRQAEALDSDTHNCGLNNNNAQFMTNILHLGMLLCERMSVVDKDKKKKNKTTVQKYFKY